MIFRRFIEIFRIPVFVLCSSVIIFLGLYFEVFFMIPPFVGTLYVLYMEQGVRFRNILGGHLIGLVCALAVPLFLNNLNLGFGGNTLVSALVISVAIAISTFIMSATQFKHEPAIATVLLFFEIGHGHGHSDLLFGFIPMIPLIMFLAGLVLVSLISWIYLRSR